MAESPDRTFWTQKEWDDFLASEGMGSTVGYEEQPGRVEGFTDGVKEDWEEVAEDTNEYDSPQSCPIRLGTQISDSAFRIHQPGERPVEDEALGED